MTPALLDRLAYGARPAELALLRRDGGARGWIEEQLQPGAQDPELEERLARARLRIRYTAKDGTRVDELRPLSLLDQSQEALWPLSDRARVLPNEERLRPLHELTAARLLRAACSRWQLRERMVEFWLDHFSVYAGDPQTAVSMPEFEREVLRRHALGNFGQLLEATAAGTPMLIYLNNRSSRTGAPNENFARELLELHTLGRRRYLNDRYARWREVPGAARGAPQGYIDQDVYEAARAFTGWAVEDGRTLGKGVTLPATGRFRYLESWHDPYQKRVLAQELDAFAPPLADGRRVLELLAEHPGTAEFLCEKLCRRFVADRPPPSLVASAARVWTAQRRHPQQLARVLAHIFDAPEFARALADPGSAKLKRPLELALSLVRKLELPFTPSPGLFSGLDVAGQPLYRWRTPDGPPDVAAPWLSSHGLRQRWSLALGLMDNTLDTGELQPAHLARGAAAPDAAALLRHHAAALLGGEAAADAVLQRLAPTGVLPAAGAPPDDPQAWPALRRSLAYVAMSPEFQWK